MYVFIKNIVCIYFFGELFIYKMSDYLKLKKNMFFFDFFNVLFFML